SFVFFSLIAPPTTQIYTLSLHDALPISQRDLVEPRDGGVDDAEAIFAALHLEVGFVEAVDHDRVAQEAIGLEDVECELAMGVPRSEEHTSELQSRENLVCRLLLEKKNKR